MTPGHGNRTRDLRLSTPMPMSRSCNSSSDANMTDSVHNQLGHWPHNLSSMLASLGCTLGLCNISRFAVLSIHFGDLEIVDFVSDSFLRLGMTHLDLEIVDFVSDSFPRLGMSHLYLEIVDFVSDSFPPPGMTHLDLKIVDFVSDSFPRLGMTYLDLEIVDFVSDSFPQLGMTHLDLEIVDFVSGSFPRLGMTHLDFEIVDLGIGIALLVSQALIGIYSIVGVSWMFIYFRDSFITKLDRYRWAEPYELYREDSRPLNGTYKLEETVPDYLNGVVLQRHNLATPESTFGHLKFQVTFNLAVVWMIVFVCLSKGRSTSHCVELLHIHIAHN
uniref:Uncharacterized protein n=1 Tax=Timema monikensis TaxID=170555 RepID=A0A7R9EBC6_9NEOP|nr:unnamed protein product [Timema monikensis]